jgi:hypothetical protein
MAKVSDITFHDNYRYSYYCNIPNDYLYDKNEITELWIESSTSPVAEHSTPDLILRCNDCGALIPHKWLETHEGFHNWLMAMGRARI